MTMAVSRREANADQVADDGVLDAVLGPEVSLEGADHIPTVPVHVSR
jgi:hypothetical protein